MEDREKLKAELLEELRKEYTLIPIKERAFSVRDIIEKYEDNICKTCDIVPTWNNKQSIGNALRKVMCLHFKCSDLKAVDVNERVQFREELERFIKEYIIGER